MPRRISSCFAVATAALGLALAAGAAQAAQIDLQCAGKGPRNEDSAGTALCAAVPGKARVVSGVLRNDAGKPVAGKVAVTFANWIPTAGGAFSITPESTRTIGATGNGQFSVPVKTDEKLGVTPFKAQADVSRQLQTVLKKLGGGRVRLTVKGAGKNPLKLYVLDSSGYELPGVKPKKADKGGSAVFDLGGRHGEFSYYVDAGVLGDLFWEGPCPTFKL